MGTMDVLYSTYGLSYPSGPFGNMSSPMSDRWSLLVWFSCGLTHAVCAGATFTALFP